MSLLRLLCCGAAVISVRVSATVVLFVCAAHQCDANCKELDKQAESVFAVGDQMMSLEGEKR